ncbi:hypothetical protein CsSME_00015578 [Camellia sinensis var. sinensis]
MRLREGLQSLLGISNDDIQRRGGKNSTLPFVSKDIPAPKNKTIYKKKKKKKKKKKRMRSSGVGLVVVVEYLESSMSEHLLCKFPDNSAFDFDYSQSSIWSPLVHRHFPPPPSFVSAALSTTSHSDIPTQRKLSYEDEKKEDCKIN